MQISRASRKADKNLKLRVKNEPPGLEEAMLAATGMSDDPAQQVELAAMLLGLPLDASNIKALNAAKPRGNVVDISVRGGASRTVVVEKRRSIRVPAPRIGDIPVRAFGGQLRLGRTG